jgi:antitoxin StbD
VAVLSHNKAAFYMVEPALFEAMLDQMADRDLENLVRSRLEQKAQAISVDIDTV